MYVRRVQIINYGPIDRLDINFPFEGDVPIPIVLVGENGSGKSLLLSHIVNGLIEAKNITYPDASEVDVGKVYKIRSDSYIKSGRSCYFARVDFENALFIEEIRSVQEKEATSSIPKELSGIAAQEAWRRMAAKERDHFHSNFSVTNEDKVKGAISENCVLYFPPNRFEDPAWLNEMNLRSKAQYMGLKHIKGHTSRKMINYSPLHDNQNWLFEAVYDSAVFERQTVNIPVPLPKANQPISLPVLLGASGNATRIYNIALQVVRGVMKRSQAIRFGIGGRSNRVVSVVENDRVLVPNIFQMSAGETSLLNLFLSILRDFDLCGSSFSKAEDIRGIAVVDEIDLHLHAVHQHEVLPKLMRMFPRIQFVVTTHSPLVVLGMKNIFGEEGFAVHRLPHGQQTSPEDFSEFANAYQAFTTTSKFSDDIRAALEKTKKPIVFVEGTTDEKYLRRAAQLLGRESVLQKVEIGDGGGAPGLKNIWNGTVKLPSELVPQNVIVLHDCDSKVSPKDQGTVFRRQIPWERRHPVEKGIENRFSRETLEKARRHKPAFIDVTSAHTKITRGSNQSIPEKWAVNKDEKTNLCNWLCENGTADDFVHFSEILDLLQEIMEPASLLSDK